MLQRGRGAGFLNGLLDPDAARPLLVRCVIEDPRTDRQVEDRENYYSELAVALQVDIAPLAAHLFAKDDGEFDEFRTGLTLGVLSYMARRGCTETIPVLRDYVARGSNWLWALHDLSAIGPDAIDGLADVIAGRFDDGELIEATGFEVGEPWDPWRAVNARLAEAHRQAQRSMERPPADEPTATLLESRNGWGRLRDRRSEIELIRRTARDGRASINARRNALILLGQWGDRSQIDVADDALSSGSRDLENAGWRYFMRLLKDGPVHEMRRWADRRGTSHQSLAAHMFGDWGTETDAPEIRAMLAQLSWSDDNYAHCSLIEGLARVGDARDVPVLQRTFDDTDYSYLRVRAGRGLARLRPDFASTVAVECLWDSEEPLRELGSSRASLASDGVPSRLRVLSTSEVEAAPVKVAAGARLA